MPVAFHRNSAELAYDGLPIGRIDAMKRRARVPVLQRACPRSHRAEQPALRLSAARC